MCIDRHEIERFNIDSRLGEFLSSATRIELVGCLVAIETIVVHLQDRAGCVGLGVNHHRANYWGCHSGAFDLLDR